MAVKRLERLVPLFVLLLGACDDGFGPGFWVVREDTVEMFSASRPEYVGLRSALDVVTEPVTAIPLESPGVTGNWDVALTDEGNGLALTPAAAFNGLASRARVAVLPGVRFEELERAPSDTSAYSAEPVALRQDAVYVIRSRRAQCGLSNGFRYAKVKAVAIDAERGTARLVVVRNPFCEDRSFVPPEQ